MLTKTKAIIMGVVLGLEALLCPNMLFSETKNTKKLEETVNEDVKFVRSLDLEKLEKVRSSISVVPFYRYRKIKINTDKLDISELESMVELNDRVYRHSNMTHNANLNDAIMDPRKYIDLIEDTTRKLRFGKIEDMNKDTFIRWNNTLPRYWAKYRKPRDYLLERRVDLSYMDQLLKDSKGRYNGIDIICRNYATITEQVYNLSKHRNRNMLNTLCLRVRNNNHMWNSYLTMTSKGIYMTSADPTFDDSGHEFKINTRMSNGLKSWFEDPGAIYLYATELLHTHGRLEEADAIFDKYMRGKKEYDKVSIIYFSNRLECIKNIELQKKIEKELEAFRKRLELVLKRTK